MNNFNPYLFYSDVVDRVFDKMFFNKQLTQFEYNTLVECSKLKPVNKDYSVLINKAQDLLDIEEELDFMHCETITRY